MDENDNMRSHAAWPVRAVQNNKPDLPSGTGIRLPAFIHTNMRRIVQEWETFARTLTPAANDMTALALRDHIDSILDFIVTDITSYQTPGEQVEKSRGEKEPNESAHVAQLHAALRFTDGFDIDQMVSEYRALRASVIKLWGRANLQMNSTDIVDLTRFNEAIDQISAESVSHYTKKVSQSKDMFIGILSHDLRTPLNAISMSAQLQLTTAATVQQLKLASQICESTARITQIVDDLLDMTRARLGSGLPVVRGPMDMGIVAQQLVNEMRAAHPDRVIALETRGELQGEWDKGRISQVLSNLVGNAIQYSFADSAIDLTVDGTSKEVVLSLHNDGVPIPQEKIRMLFDALTRGVANENESERTPNLGLGLFIAKEVVLSHGGTIDVTSSQSEGTIFTARFPRSARRAA